MELTEYINGEEFKKTSKNKKNLIKYVICYYLLFKDEFSNVDELLNRVNDSNIDNNFSSIIRNKLMSKNTNIKSIYKNILDTMGNLKFELVDDNDTDYFGRITTILNKYNINLNVRDTTIISNDLDKIIDCYNMLDSKIVSIVNLMNNRKDIFFSKDDYEKIRNLFYKYLVNNNLKSDDIIEILYLLDSHFYNVKNRIVITNNVKASEENLSEIIKKYKSDINLYIKDLLNNKKERKGEEKKELASFSFNKELNDDFIIGYLDIQEKQKDILSTKISEEENLKSYLEEDFNHLNKHKSKKI